MRRFYYISDDLDDLAQVEQELESAGIAKQQVHIFSNDDHGIERRQLHNVQEFMKRDVVRAGLLGAVVGVVAAAVVLTVTYFSGITSEVGWAPFLLLAVLIAGFCTWEGGFFGINSRHHDLRNFDGVIGDGKHILFVDASPRDAKILLGAERRHPHLIPAGEGAATPGWAITWQKKWHDFMHAMP